MWVVPIPISEEGISVLHFDLFSVWTVRRAWWRRPTHRTAASPRARAPSASTPRRPQVVIPVDEGEGRTLP
jgi:hypothetical protein